MQIKYLFGGLTQLGESPVWHPDMKLFFWTDLKGKKIFSLDISSESLIQYEVEDNVAAMAPKKGRQYIFLYKQNQLNEKGNGFVCAFARRGFGEINIVDNQAITKYFDINPLSNMNDNFRFNDGKCSPNGQFFAGIMDENCDDIGPSYVEQQIKNNSQQAQFYQLNYKSTTFSTMLDKQLICNGPTWNGNKFYMVCSGENIIYQYDFLNNSFENKTLLLEMDEDINGYFDGSTIDSQGYLWWAIFAGQKIIRIDPQTAKVIQKITLDIDSPTSVAFGGENYQNLLVTCKGGGNNQNNGGICLIQFDSNIQGIKPSIWNEK